MKTEDFRDEISEEFNENASPSEKNEIRKMAKAIQRKCEEQNIPMIFVMCTKKDGYQIKCLLPGEFENNGELGNHPNRFPELLRAAKGFDKTSYMKLTMQNNHLSDIPTGE